MAREEKGQPTLPGLEKRPALVHLLTPEAAGINPNDYTDLTDEMLYYASPRALSVSLINVDRDGRSVLWHKPDPRGPVVTLAVNPEDYNNIARSVEHLSRAVINKTLGSYSITDRFSRDNQAAAERSAVHSLESKIVKIDERLEELAGQRDLLGIFREMATPERRNLRRSYEARPQFKELMKDVVGSMVNAVGNHRQYDTEAMERMRRSIEARLYIRPGEPGEREEYFDQLAEVGQTYFGHLVIMYATRRYEAARYIREHS